MNRYKKAMEYLKVTSEAFEKTMAPEMKEAMAAAVDALEKQVPDEPYLVGYGYEDGKMVYKWWHCPYCNKMWDSEDKYTYCQNCGKRIKWEGIKDE